MSRKSLLKNIESQSLSYSVSYFTSSPQQKIDKQEELPQSSSPQIASSSHEVFGQQNGNKNKKKKSKAKQKDNNLISKNTNFKNKYKGIKYIQINQKIISTKTNKETNIHGTNKKLKNDNKKTQKTLNKFLGKNSSDESEFIKIKKVATFQLNPVEVNYINKFQFFKGYSLQKYDPNEQKKMVRNKKDSQATLNRFLSQRVKCKKQQDLEQQKNEQQIYSKSYIVIQSILKILRQSQEVHSFFKQQFEQIQTLKADQRFIQQYNKLIEHSLDLKTLQSMFKEGQINNLMEFQGIFNQMIVNSIIIHTHLDNKQMLKHTNFLHQLYHKLMIQHAYPRIDELQKSSIKITAFAQKPKSKKVAIERESKQVDYMDLNDLLNKNRIKVMNHFLRLLCKKNPQNFNSFIHRIRNLIHRYPEDKVEMIRQAQKQNESLKQFSSMIGNQKLDSQRSSQNFSSQIEKSYQIYQISVQSISVNLFQQLKQLIKSQLRQVKRLHNRGEQSDEIVRNILYPHNDSDDFDSMNQSDDT